MIKQVDHPREIEPLQELGDLRPDAFQRLHFREQRVEDFRPHGWLLARLSRLAMRCDHDYMAQMPSDPELKRLHWRAHHRGTREADLMIGGFFDAHHRAWS